MQSITPRGQWQAAQPSPLLRIPWFTKMQDVPGTRIATTTLSDSSCPLAIARPLYQSLASTVQMRLSA